MLKILIIRFSSIGDIVLTTPVIRCIKQQIKNVELHYLTKKQFQPVLLANPYIDQLHFHEGDLGDTVAELKKEKFDYIIDLHNNQRTFIIKWKTGVKSFSFQKLNFEKWLIVNFKINKLPHVHIVDRYFETTKSLNVENDGHGLDYFIPEQDEINIRETLPSVFHQGYIAFVIGARHFTKQLPLHKCISLCQKINKPIVLLGGIEDNSKAELMMEAINSKSATPNFIFNACGKYNLNQSASLIKQSKKIITHDTGLMHIAAAFKKEIISIWGNTIPEFGMYPYYGNSSIVHSKSEIVNLPCRPCSKIGFEKCPLGHFKCMEEIDEQEIVGQIL